jgi:hypothetical protein
MQRVSTRAWCVLYNMCLCRVSGIAGVQMRCVRGFGRVRQWILQCPEQRCVGYERGQSAKQGSTRREKEQGQTGHDMRRKAHATRNVSSDEPPVVKSALATCLAPLAFGKRIPETECLVPGARDNCLAIRAHREVEDATRVASQRCNHLQ